MSSFSASVRLRSIPRTTQGSKTPERLKPKTHVDSGIVSADCRELSPPPANKSGRKLCAKDMPKGSGLAVKTEVSKSANGKSSNLKATLAKKVIGKPTSGKTAISNTVISKPTVAGGITTNKQLITQSPHEKLIELAKPAVISSATTRVKPPANKAAAVKPPARTKALVNNAGLGFASARSERLVMSVGSANDHTAIHHLFRSLEMAPARDGFCASLDDPFYEPTDRLLIRRGPQVLAHAHLLRRTMMFGQLQLPVAGLTGLVTLPEFRRQGLARSLVRAADRPMRKDGAVVALTTTRFPHFLHSEGWAVCGRHTHSRAGTRDLLALLSARGVPPAENALFIRPWRQVELPGLMRCYAAAMAGSIGPYERTEAYWRWLVSRQDFDRVFVALDPANRAAWDSFDAPIVGYVILKEDRILELVAPREMTPGRKPHTATLELLGRACGEAIERDYHSVQLHAAPNDRLHEVFSAAGGSRTHHESQQGEVMMAKLLDPVGLLRRLGPVLMARAREAELPATVDLGLAVDNDKFQITVTRRGVKVDRQRLGRSYLRLRRAELTRLLLGHSDVTESLSQDRLTASTRLAAETAAVLFPRVPYWRVPWDELMY